MPEQTRARHRGSASMKRKLQSRPVSGRSPRAGTARLCFNIYSHSSEFATCSSPHGIKDLLLHNLVILHRVQPRLFHGEAFPSHGPAFGGHVEFEIDNEPIPVRPGTLD